MAETTKDKTTTGTGPGITVADLSPQPGGGGSGAPQMTQAELDAAVEEVRAQLEGSDVDAENVDVEEPPLPPAELNTLLAEAKEVAVQLKEVLPRAALASGDSGKVAAFNAAAAEAQALLGKMAVLLRNRQLRPTMADTDLPSTLVDFLTSTIDCVSNAELRAAYLPVLQQLMRVAANLCADNETGPSKMAQVKWPQTWMSLIRRQGSKMPMDELYPAVIAMANTTAEGNLPSMECLRQPDNLRALIKLADELYTPGKWTYDDYDMRIQTALSLWTLIDHLTSSGELPLRLTVEDVKHFLPAFGALLPRESPTGLSPDVDMEEAYEADMSVVVHVYRILSRFFDQDKASGIADVDALLADGEAVRAIMDFVERADVPDWPEAQGWSGKDERKTTLAKFKGEAATSLMDLLGAHVKPGHKAPEFITQRLDKWVGMTDRPDLQAVALLILGNLVRSDASAIALFESNPGLPRRLVAMLNANTPVPVLHSLTGLLRNVAIPAPNKRILGEAGVFGGLEAARVWDSSRDMVQSIQGNAVVLVKHLVRDRTNAIEWLGMTPLLDALHALIRRTDAPSIVFEATRIWVNCARALTPPSADMPSDPTATQRETALAWKQLMDDRVLGELTAMFMQASNMPLLLNEALLAFALLARQPQHRPALIEKLLDESEYRKALEAKPDAAPEAESGARALARVIAPPANRKIPPEMQDNALALLRLLESSEINSVVDQQVTRNTSDNLPVAPAARACLQEMQGQTQ